MSQATNSAFDRVFDLTGKALGRLTVLGRADRPAGSSDTSAHWSCRCECGREVVVSRKKMRNGSSAGCGCKRNAPKHGKRYSSEYQSWAAMLQRCGNENHVSFSDYGGRGITVTKAWRDFAVFYADMGPMPAAGYSLERLDVNGDYGPHNCVWLLKARQARNTRRNVLSLPLVRDLRRAKRNGKTVRGWASRHGVPEAAAYKAAEGKNWADVDG